LPAGEIYYVPTGASGQFPLKFEDGTVGLMTVKEGRIVDSSLLKGSQRTIDEYQRKIQSDPATGELGELGFGTQLLPVSGRDIQDEKVLGTLHVATGRSDHLGGHLKPSKFLDKRNATHDGEPIRIALRRSEHDVVPVTLPGGRHEDGARHAGGIHLSQKLLGGQRRRLVRAGRLARRPRALGRVGGPDMQLGIDDHHGRSLVLKHVRSRERPARGEQRAINPVSHRCAQ
jgi:hypothetical protein